MTRKVVLMSILVGSGVGLASAQEKYDPTADPAAVVVSGNARFTVLTPGVVRMEWSPDGKFEDRASYAFINRRLTVPKFERTEKDGWLTIDTAVMTVRYKVGGRFEKDGLAVRIKMGPKAGTEVCPPFKDDANLGGTTRTLDGISGACSLEPGLLSRNGWTCVDDSHRILFDGDSIPSPLQGVERRLNKEPRKGGVEPQASSWPWAAPRGSKGAVDWYFFVYGHDYKGALGDFIKIAGRIPLPPRFVFGAWWSRYWDYTDAELRELVAEFKEHDVPLDVLVIDMGWHLDGWTGYTWNPKCFPDPEGFLKWAHEQGLKVTLNLHPAEGVGKQEKAFPDFCRAMGLDPANTDRVPFDCTDRRFVDAYFELLHHPLEKMGVDFWWMDYQQDRTTKIPGLDPLPWLNYLHWMDMERRELTTEGTEKKNTKNKDSPGHSDSSVPSVSSVAKSSSRRPLIFSRWGGLGNHRYQIGFSGDTFCNWQSLAFQPYFTATAGNVGYAYWSHDIGGHQPGPVDPELYVRWIQWGAFSPILRTHTTKNPEAERRIWKFPQEYFEAAKKAYELRYELIPYIYTSARQCYDTGLPLCRPLYYEWPEIEEAYAWKNEYMFGDQLLVAPVTEPAEPISGCAMVEVWIPPGDWTNWFTGRTYTGPKVIPLVVPLDEIPLFVKSGGIVPIQRCFGSGGETFLGNVNIQIFSTEPGAVTLYEDDGQAPRYTQGDCARADISSRTDSLTQHILIAHPKGHYQPDLSDRDYTVEIVNVPPATRVLINGKTLEPVPKTTGLFFDGAGWSYSPRDFSLLVQLTKGFCSLPMQLLIEYRKDATFQMEHGRSGVRQVIELLDAAVEAFEHRQPPQAIEKAAAQLKEIFWHSNIWQEQTDRLLSDWLEYTNAINESSLECLERQRLVVRLTGLFYRTSLRLDPSDSRRMLVSICLASTLPIPSLREFVGKVSLSTDSDSIASATKTIAVTGLPYDEPLSLDATLACDEMQATVIRARIQLKRKSLSIEIPIERLLFPSINAWHILGPFDAPFDKALDTPFPPETKIDLKAEYAVGDLSPDRKGGVSSQSEGPSHSGADRLLTRAAPLGHKIGWKEYKRQIKPGDDLTGEFFVDFDDVFGQRVYDCVVYGFTYLDAPEDMDAVLRFGTDDGYVLFLNGKEIQRKAIGRPYSSKSDEARVRLKKGRNELLLKISQGGGDGGFCVHVEDEKGKPLTAVKARLK